MKKGFGAYEEIRNLAERTYKGHNVSVQASIFGNEYIILVDDKERLKGTSEIVREKLLKGEN